MNLRQCSDCKRVLPEEYFAPKSIRCRICRRDYDWQYRYGVSPEQYFEIYKAQGGKCKICGYEPKGNEYLHIDHDKETGEIRGLLCSKCNKGLGLFGEEPDNFDKAKRYIEENK